MKLQRIILVVVALLFGIPTLAFRWTGIDSSSYVTVAQTILDGGMPYRDAWDTKAPLTFYVYAVPMTLFGTNQVALRSFDVLWELATALVLFNIAMRIYGRREIGVLAGILYLLAYYSQSIWDMAQTDGFLNLPMALSLLWLLRAVEDDRISAWAIAAAWVGVATLFKVPFGLMGIAMIIVAVTEGRPKWNRSLRRLSALALGFAAPLLLLGIYFYARGALWDLVTSMFVAGPQHALLSQNSEYFGCMAGNLDQKLRIPLYTLGLLGLAPLFFSMVGKQGDRLSKKLLWCWFGVGLIVLLMHGEFLGYHFTPMLAPLAILAAETLYSVYAAGLNRRNLMWWPAMAAFLLIVVYAGNKTVKNGAYEWDALHGVRPQNDWEPVSAYVKSHTSPEDRIFVWGLRPAIYLDTGLKPATRFLDHYHIAFAPKGLDYRGIFLREFQASKPKYFILSTPTPPPPDRPNPCGSTEADTRKTFAEFASFKALIDQDYQRESPGGLGPYEVYRRKQ
jgi:4-amino-4-deoxy-L-arabinose transferase-like glycosyltransferase